ncbi:MAG: hypothetical protein A3G24_19760 [Betaproteobacteria bacterium RIFCSPLOWO2_12_FULL_62_13]|nr:MAG: hypothetical protein A3G24_19760 [Betaproteobacteria bacterium RIFCSPLOWO2_12_FULL_62_13]
MTRSLIIGTMMLLLFDTSIALSESYPVKPIRMIAPSEAGSSPDVFARFLGEKLTNAWGERIVIDNRAGAAGVIGYEILSRAPGDGYTIAMAAVTLSTTPNVVKKLSYDPVNSFTQISTFASVPYVVVVSAQLPAKSVKEFFALAKKRSLNYGTPGTGSSQHLATELLKLTIGVPMTHIPYRGGPAMVNAILTGEAHIIFGGLMPSLPMIKAGKLRVLAVTTARRFPTMPNVPTMAESGVPGFELDNWHAVIAPASVPKSVLRRLNAEIVKTLGLPEIKERLLGMGAKANPSTPEEAHRYISAEVAKWKKAAKAAGIEPQ